MRRALLSFRNQAALPVDKSHIRLGRVARRGGLDVSGKPLRGVFVNVALEALFLRRLECGNGSVDGCASVFEK